jgi:hypothetical protein
MTRLLAAAVLFFAAACSSDKIDVAPSVGSDKNRGAVLSALADLRAAQHTPMAFRHYSDRILALRAGMDETVADEAELLSVTEALVVLQRAAATQAPLDALALTVWPLGLAPEIAADVPGQPSPDEWAAWIPQASDSPGTYLERLCGGVLALECKDVVPEGHLAVVDALVLERFTERARRAVATCLTCGEPGWKANVAGWEALDREATAHDDATRERFHPRRWPIAGEGAVDVPEGKVPLVELDPAARAERVRYALEDARARGVPRIALVAREVAYPYRRRAYLIPAGAKLPVRDGEPVQVLTRALDAAARRR